MTPMVLAAGQELQISGGYATKAGAARAVKRVDKAFYANVNLTIEEQPSAEWARAGITKSEFVIIATAKEN